MEATRILAVTLISARDLQEEVHHALVSLSGDFPQQQQKADACTGGHNPTWDATRRFDFPATGVPRSLRVLLCTIDHRDVGEVNIQISKDLSLNSDVRVDRCVSKISGGRQQGYLKLSYRLVESGGSRLGDGVIERAMYDDMNNNNGFDTSRCGGGAVNCAGGVVI